MNRLLTYVAVTTIMIVSVLLVVRIVGNSTKSDAAVILDQGACSSPCWHSLQPGETTLDQARKILDSDDTLTVLSNRPACWMVLDRSWYVCVTPSPGDANYRIDTISLYLSTGTVRFGDVVLLFGGPIAIEGIDQPIVHFTGIMAMFDHDQVCQKQRFNMTAIIHQIHYSRPEQFEQSNEEGKRREAVNYCLI